ncbi:MAG: NUDIX hydrolase [Candidatus Hinthialibacter antarcticus]|nr:NUDIX hydrolase [Candidatus Hinthialibacter antarcticus]
MTEQEFVRPNVTADIVIPNEAGEVLLIKRKNPPFQHHWAIPGGFLEVHQETVEQCAVREAKEETGLDVEIERLVGIYSDPKRDPRWHNVTAVYLAKPLSMEQAAQAVAGDDAADVLWINPKSTEFSKLTISFDHPEIIRKALGIKP